MTTTHQFLRSQTLLLYLDDTAYLSEMLGAKTLHLGRLHTNLLTFNRRSKTDVLRLQQNLLALVSGLSDQVSGGRKDRSSLRVLIVIDCIAPTIETVPELLGILVGLPRGGHVHVGRLRVSVGHLQLELGGCARMPLVVTVHLLLLEGLVLGIVDLLAVDILVDMSSHIIELDRACAL